CAFLPYSSLSTSSADYFSNVSPTAASSTFPYTTLFRSMTRVRKYIEEHCEWERIQEVLLDCWKRDVDNSHVLLMDATCYESYIRFPTDVKLLWESCHWVFEKQLYRLCKVFRIKRPRSKYTDQKRKQLAYS